MRNMEETKNNGPSRLLALYIFLYFNFTKLIRFPSWRYAFGKLESLTRPRKTRDLDTDKSKAIFEELETKGHTGDVNPLTNSQVKEMYDFLSQQEIIQYRSGVKKASTLDKVPNDWSTAYIPTETVLHTPHLFTLANDPDILAAIENRFGCKPELGVIQALWRFPNDGEPVNDEKWHRDFESLNLIKCFIYLTDVDLKSGPHMFVETSHRKEKLFRIGKGIDNDDELEMAYGKEKIVTKVGPAGTCFLEETTGWHKGTKPITKPRLMLMLVFSIYPVYYKDRNIARIKIKSDQDAYFDEHIFKNHILPLNEKR